MSSAAAITLFVIGVIIAIMIHEWGHFVAARRFGMRADRFFFGFGPTLWSIRRGETEYGVKALPLGGFVSIRGMSPTDERRKPVVEEVLAPDLLAEDRRATADDTGVPLDEVPAVPERTWGRFQAELEVRGTPRKLRQLIMHRIRLNIAADATPAEARVALAEILVSEVPQTGGRADLRHRLLKGDEGRFYADRPAWQRAIVVAAGSGMHFVQAFVLLFVGFLLFGDQSHPPVVGEVVEGSPAAEAGLQEGDRIVSVAGDDIEDFFAAADLIRERPGQRTELIVRRDGEDVTLTGLADAVKDEASGETIGRLGFVPVQPEYGPLPVGEALYETFAGPTSVPWQVKQTFVGLGTVFGPEGLESLYQQVTGQVDRNLEGGVSLVGVAQSTGSATQQAGPLFLFFVLAFINVFVGIFNILPLPPLDGGHLAVVGIEKVVNTVRARRGRATDYKVDAHAIAAVALPVLVFIGTVSIALLWLDIVNPIQMP